MYNVFRCRCTERTSTSISPASPDPPDFYAPCSCCSFTSYACPHPVKGRPSPKLGLGVTEKVNVSTGHHLFRSLGTENVNVSTGHHLFRSLGTEKVTSPVEFQSVVQTAYQSDQ